MLCVEDNPANFRLIERILKLRPGVRLLSAAQGRLGIDLAREHRPDVIFLDLHLPDIQGDEVLRQLRDDAATRDIPVIILSADATPHQIERLLAAGANRYMVKPLDVKEFLQILDETLKEGSIETWKNRTIQSRSRADCRRPTAEHSSAGEDVAAGGFHQRAVHDGPSCRPVDLRRVPARHPAPGSAHARPDRVRGDGTTEGHRRQRNLLSHPGVDGRYFGGDEATGPGVRGQGFLDEAV